MLNRDQALFFWNLLLGALVLGASFIFLTSAIPLIQWGWIPSFGESKKVYVKLVRIAVVVSALSLIAFRIFRKEDFYRLWIVRVARRVAQMPLAFLLTALFAVYGISHSITGFLRHAAFETRAFDLGIFAQAVWNTLRGDLLYSSLKGGICLLGDHFAPILALIAPFYRIWPDPRMLILLQAFSGALCILCVAAVARSVLKERSWILLFAVLYFIFYPARAALHEDFHPEVLVEPFLFLAFLALETGQISGFLACLLMIVTAKENMFGIAFMFGVYAFFFKKEHKLGGLLMLGSLGAFWAVIQFVIPFFSHQPYFYTGNYQAMLAGQGSALFARLSALDSWEYVLRVLLPFLYLPLMHLPTFLLALPVLLQNILSQNEAMRSFNYHYLSGLTPFLFISCMCGIREILRRFPVMTLAKQGIALALLLVGLLTSGAPEYYFLWRSSQNADPQGKTIRAQMRAISRDARVFSHNNLIPHMIHRKHIFQFDYSASRTKLEQSLAERADVVVMWKKIWEPGTPSLEAELPEFFKAGYRIDFQEGDFYILKKFPQGIA
ncbi:MAG: DUF2079 domain-containing protein [Candidatus Omnitrophota bacterium]